MLFPSSDLAFVEAVARLAYENPFLPARIDREREALGEAFVDDGATWVADWASLTPPETAVERPNVVLLRDRSFALATKTALKLSGASPGELALYEDLALYALFARYEVFLYPAAADESDARPRLEVYRDFRKDFTALLEVDGVELPSAHDPAHVFAIFFQIRRAFHHIFRVILGRSLIAARLRAAVWQSIFTHDLRRYQRDLYSRMHDVPTLILGPSGTGKDLVAQAIGKSRFIPFDAKALRFVEAYGPQFHAMSLAALPSTLVESELFGHKRGAFTGAVETRPGRLEACGRYGTAFLDEIGELEPALQVKLLRVLQDRSFQRLGESEPRRFEGKVAAATNRNLDHEMHAGRFREDLYYRLCADRIETPRLAERLAEHPAELETLVSLLAQRIGGSESAETLTDQVVSFVERHLGPRYAWPGNVRELEQCIRSVMLRAEYRPHPAPPKSSLDAALLASGIEADALLDRYCSLVYAKTQSYVETGRRLGLDRRTVKQRVENFAASS